MRIAFLGFNKVPHKVFGDASYIYRALNLGHSLRERGHVVWLGHMRHFNPFSAWDVVVLHRPVESLYLHLLRMLLKRRRVLLLADVDDLIFDSTKAACSPAVVNEMQAVDTVRKRYMLNAKALAGVDGVTVSTRSLYERMHAQWQSQPLLLAPNSVHHSWLNMPLQPRSEFPVLTYNPGTRSHDRDFALVLPALVAVMAAREDVHLRITGPLEFDASGLPQARVHRRPRVPFETYHACLDGAWVNLAPLEGSSFNDCKSALKVIEAGWWGLPTVTLNLPDAERFQGVAAWPAQTPKDFGDVVLKAITAIEQGAVNAQAVRDSVLRQADVHVVAAQWLQWVAGLCK